MKKVSEVFKLPVIGNFGMGFIKSVTSREKICYIEGATQEQLSMIVHCLNTYDQLKEERDEAVELLEIVVKAFDPKWLGIDVPIVKESKQFLSRVRKNSTTVSGDDTDKEK